MSLKKFRAFGREHAIPLQVVALLIALVDAVIWGSWMIYVMHKLDDHSRLLGLGPLGWGGWMLLVGTVTSALTLWVILRLLDADLNEGGGS